MTANFILGFVTGLPIGLAISYIIVTVIAHRRRPVANPYLGMAQGTYTPRNDEPTELDQ